MRVPLFFFSSSGFTKRVVNTFESLKDASKAIVHFYNSTLILQRKVVFDQDKKGIKKIATNAPTLIKNTAEKNPNTDWTFEYSPESFTGTELEYAREVWEEVVGIVGGGRGGGRSMGGLGTGGGSGRGGGGGQGGGGEGKVKGGGGGGGGVQAGRGGGGGGAASECGGRGGGDRGEGTVVGKGEGAGKVGGVGVGLNGRGWGGGGKLGVGGGGWGGGEGE
jgi:Isopropylmalate/homocitrate/citramalate synthases